MSACAKELVSTQAQKLSFLKIFHSERKSYIQISFTAKIQNNGGVLQTH
jgi:hypothetical protein